jgi:ATP-dependent helicase/nuclease subunit A
LKFSTNDWREGLKQMLPSAEIFIELVQEFGKEYRRAKDAARSLDFSDLERFTLTALCESASNPQSPSSAAQAFHRRFAHVLVDEFQDINEVQDAILSLVSRECMAPAPGNLFCVGDVKQSIYRFRLAEPARFLDRQRQYREKSGHGRVIDLRANFRSRLPLLDALNRVFACLMTKDAVDIEYDQYHRLQGKAVYPDVSDGPTFPGAPIEVHLLPGQLGADGADSEESSAPSDDEADESEAIEREAMLMAMEIRRMVGLERGFDAMMVMEKGAGGRLQPRPARFRDIVILLRSMQRKADQIAGVLRRYGIDVHAASRAGYFEAMEIRDMLALLSLLDNQRQDIPLAALLRSPLGEISEPESSLAKIRAAYPESVPFHESAIRYQAEKNDLLASQLKTFYARLARWRTAARQRPLADVIWSIYHQTGYLTFVAGLDQGDQRVRNLIDLHERAAQFGKFQNRGLSRFMRFLEQLEEESDLGQPSLGSDAENVVRIMSVHASKGLEFPIVFVPDIGKRINMQSCRGAILADRHAGLGMMVVDEARRCRYPSLASAIVETRLVQQSLAEEMRVLYVAMTRAREHLILVATCKSKEPDAAMEQWLSRWADHDAPLPTDAILSAGSTLDWIGPVAAMTCNEAAPVFQVKTHPPQEVANWQAPGATRNAKTPEQLAMARLEPLPETPSISHAAQAVIDNLSFAYPYQSYSDMPAAQSVTSGSHAAVDVSREIVRNDAIAPAASRDANLLVSSEPGRVAPDFGEFSRAVAPTPNNRTSGPPGPTRPGSDPQFRSTGTPSLPQPRFIERAVHSAADRGTITHLVIEHLDFSGPCDDADIARQIESLIELKILAADDAAIVDRVAITWLMASPVGQLLRKPSASVRRELPVNFPWSPESAANADPLDRVMVRGRIDALILEGKVGTLLDYKTDSVSAEQVAERAESYRPQLQAYREAIQRIAGVRIDDMYLAFLSPRVMYRL